MKKTARASLGRKIEGRPTCTDRDMHPKVEPWVERHQCRLSLRYVPPREYGWFPYRTDQASVHAMSNDRYQPRIDPLVRLPNSMEPDTGACGKAQQRGVNHGQAGWPPLTRPRSPRSPSVCQPPNMRYSDTLTKSEFSTLCRICNSFGLVTRVFSFRLMCSATDALPGSVWRARILPSRGVACHVRPLPGHASGGRSGVSFRQGVDLR